jgi:hypothetical protein
MYAMNGRFGMGEVAEIPEGTIEVSGGVGGKGLQGAFMDMSTKRRSMSERALLRHNNASVRSVR